ncbi:MAG: hypothetical protein ACODAE_10270 [Gemmatimonadota bacterium]
MTAVGTLLFRAVGSLAVAGGVAVAAPATAQTEALIRGRVVDTAGAAIADRTVVLHRVTEARGGEAVARAATDASGRFALALPGDSDGADGGVLFVATRADDRLYIGPTFRAGTTPPAEYRIVVGGPGLIERLGGSTPAGAASGGGGGGDGVVTGWAGAVAALAAGLLAMIGWRVQTRPPERRRLLRDLAVLEESRAAPRGADPGREADAEAAAEYDRRRAALRARLKEIART